MEEALDMCAFMKQHGAEITSFKYERGYDGTPYVCIDFECFIGTDNNNTNSNRYSGKMVKKNGLMGPYVWRLHYWSLECKSFGATWQALDDAKCEFTRLMAMFYMVHTLGYDDDVASAIVQENA